MKRALRAAFWASVVITVVIVCSYYEMMSDVWLGKENRR